MKQREHKYRAKSLDGELIYFELHESRPCGDSEVFYIWGVPCKSGTEQESTGLKDKNGKEIYEGDILSIDPISIYDCKSVIVEWQEWFSEDYWMKKKGGWIFNKITDGVMQIYTEKTIEVIGNIHENPELL